MAMKFEIGFPYWRSLRRNFSFRSAYYYFVNTYIYSPLSSLLPYLSNGSPVANKFRLGRKIGLPNGTSLAPRRCSEGAPAFYHQGSTYMKNRLWSRPLHFAASQGYLGDNYMVGWSNERCHVYNACL